MIKYLTTQEERQLIGAMGGKYWERNRNIAHIAVNTGLRVSELTGLTISDVMNGKVKEELFVRSEIAKRKAGRAIPLNNKARYAIQALITWNEKQGYKQTPDRKLLISQKGRAMTRQQVQRIIKKAREGANLEIDATPHSFRHTFATRVYGKTNNLRVVQKLLGHKSIATTQIYADVTREQLQVAVSLL